MPAKACIKTDRVNPSLNELVDVFLRNFQIKIYLLIWSISFCCGSEIYVKFSVFFKPIIIIILFL